MAARNCERGAPLRRPRHRRQEGPESPLCNSRRISSLEEFAAVYAAPSPCCYVGTGGEVRVDEIECLRALLNPTRDELSAFLSEEIRLQNRKGILSQHLQAKHE